MRNKIFTSTALFVLFCGFAKGQGTWTQKADFAGTTREFAIGLAIGNLGYVVTGSSGSSLPQELWEYDPQTNTWIQKANFPGVGRWDAVGFVIGTKIFIGTGTNTIDYYNDFWEYDSQTNTWTQKSNFPGSARKGARGFSIGSKGYIGTGFYSYTDSLYHQVPCKDFWEYNPANDTWTQKSNYGGDSTYDCVAFSIGNKGYVLAACPSLEFWEYNPTTDIWTRKADFTGPARDMAVCFSIDSMGYVGTGNPNNLLDFWEYNLVSDTWSQKVNFGGIGRYGSVGFAIGTKGYIGTGITPVGANPIYSKDLWEYNPNGTGLNEINIANSIIIFPNPFSTESTLKINQNSKNATLTIFNSFGQQVKQIKNISGQSYILHRDNLPSGLYLFRLTQDNKILKTDKLIITDN